MFTTRPAFTSPMPYQPVVVRWFTTWGPMPLEQLVQQVPPRATYALAGGGRLRVAEQFTRCDSGTVPTWSATGSVYGTGPRLLRLARINIRITAWSVTACMLQLYPASRHIRRWAAGRQERYFDLAHNAADTLAHLLAKLGTTQRVDSGQPRTD